MMRVLWTAALVITLQSRAQAAEVIITLGSVAPQDSPWHALLTKYEKAVEAKSNGRVDVRLKLGGVLGDENEMVTKCRRGQVQAVGVSTGALASLVPELNIVELPYLFRTPEEADHVLDTVLADPMDKLFRERGFVLGFWSENGFRNFGTRDGAIRKPEDLRGKKMRAQESPVHMAMYRAFGAAATPLPTTEVPQALATGNVDGFDQSALFTIAASWYKSIKHYSLSQHIYQPAVITYNAEWFDKLPADLQKIIVEEGRAMQPKGRKLVRQILAELLGMLKQNQVEVHELTAQERLAFEKLAKPTWAEFKKTHGAKAGKLLDEVEKALKGLRGQS